MSNNPLQIVLNTKDYQQIPFRTGGGGVKDFFQGRDEQFAEHRSRLLMVIDQIGSRINRPGGPALEYVHVVLNEKAWAKTKRPTEKVFPSTKIPLVGGSNLGEMIFELEPETLEVVRGSVSAAEIEVQLVPDKKTNELKPNPSRARSEVGAIESIHVHHAADRRNFSAQDAVEWLANPRTGGMYLVECFIDPRSSTTEAERRSRARAITAFNTLKVQLEQSKLPITIKDTEDQWQSIRFLFVRVNSDDVLIHENLLRFLDEYTIVRRVSLPPVLEIEQTISHSEEGAAMLPSPNEPSNYPVLGIVDTGVVSHLPLEPWCAGRTDLLEGMIQDRSHGTFIAGLSVAAQELNSHAVFGEVPCKFFDLGLHPMLEDVYEDYYPFGFMDFLEQLNVEIPAAKDAGVRIFNMSLSVQQQVADDDYGEYATLIDEIADRHNVVFVLPTGNLSGPICRPVWPDEPSQVAQMLAGYRHAGQDRLFQPAESVRSISVGALEVPDSENRFRPSVYTRRGPSIALGVKPDVAHVGGRDGHKPDLASINTAGQTVYGCGTSYAAPFVAKTMAVLDHLIEGDVERETLSGLLIHHATMPAPLQDPQAEKYAVDFVGHGMPSQALEMLTTSDHSITLAFIGNLEASHELEFPFTWPASMVSQHGSCRGRARLTLTYRAPTNRQFGAEYVRVNMNAYLRQEYINKSTGSTSWKGRLKSEGKIYERHLIENGHKWWPIKRFNKTFPRGVGNSSQWVLVVDSLSRTNTVFPESGIPFSAILTIEDPNEKEPIFNELRQTLLSSGAQISDIRTAQKITVRV